MVNTGYLLSYVKYGDNDAILHCFTQEMGFQTYFMRGIYSAKNKKKAYLAPLNELTFVANEHHKGKITNISKIEQCKTLDCTDVRASSVVFFIAEFLYQVLKTEVQQKYIYQAVKSFLSEVEQGNFQAHFMFLVEFLKIQGLTPLMGEAKYLDPESGCFEIVKHHHLFDEEISELWKNCIAQEYIYNVKIKNTLKEKFLDSVLVYYYCHFPEFKIPKSLDVLKTVFAE